MESFIIRLEKAVLTKNVKIRTLLGHYLTYSSFFIMRSIENGYWKNHVILNYRQHTVPLIF